MSVVAAAAFLGSSAISHAGLTFPIPRNNFGAQDPAVIVYHDPVRKGVRLGGPCAGGECLWFNEGCYNGCPTCSAAMPVPVNCTGPGPCPGNYYGPPNCASPREPTLPDAYRTWNIGNASRRGDFTRYHPWRSPGAAPTLDPCGVAGGYAVVTGGGGETPEGARQGDKGSLLPRHANVTTEWPAAGVAEVGWMLAANHGGGYLYSLCPAAEALTEACLARTPLRFVGSTTTVRHIAGPQNGTEITIAATDVSVGTQPAGAAWRRNPIPACNCDKGFDCSAVEGAAWDTLAYDPNGTQPRPVGFPCPTGTHFPVPFDYGYGQQLWDDGANMADPKSMNTWVLVDEVAVPAAKGEYVLRFRWDAEQNPQIWTHCADITIV
jgi:lytic starch monooxygenase